MAEPIAVRVTRYRCPFCSRGHASRSRARDHVARCWLNPENRGCKTCAHHQPFGFEGHCIPGVACICGETAEECRAGLDISGGLITGCPLWALREEATHGR